MRGNTRFHHSDSSLVPPVAGKSLLHSYFDEFLDTIDYPSLLLAWSARSPLFVGRDGDRITQGTLQSRIKRAFKRAGPDAQPVPGALVHGLRHTYATELAASDVSVYTLMKLLGHESMTTSQRYVTAAGTETRSAAAQNPLYALVPRRADDQQ
jgi:integrase